MQVMTEAAQEDLWLADKRWSQREAALEEKYGTVERSGNGVTGHSSLLMPYDPGLPPVSAQGKTSAESIVALFHEVQKRDAATALRAQKEQLCTLPYSAATARDQVIVRQGPGENPCTPVRAGRGMTL